MILCDSDQPVRLLRQLVSVIVPQMVRLTYNNYAGPTLLQSIPASGRQYPLVKGGIQRETRRNFNKVARGAPAEMKRGKSVEIDAEPLSSEDEEEDEEERTPEPTPRTKRVHKGFNEIDEGILAKQEESKSIEEGAKPDKGKSVGSRRSKRRKLANDPPEITFVHDQEKQEKDAEIVSEEEDKMTAWENEHANKKRRTQFKRYHGSGSINIHASAPNVQRKDAFRPVPAIPSPPRPGRYAKSEFQAPDELKSPPLANRKTPNFFVPAEHDLPGRHKTRSKLKDEERVFKVPDDPEIFKLPLDSTASSATTVDQPPTIFSHPDSPPRARSGSASSLSSVNSIASLLLTQDEKDSLMKNDADANPTDTNLLTAQCPLCSTPVSNALLEEFTIRHSKNKTRLPSRLQQKFCHAHRAQTARDTWQEWGYPTIDWDALATIRITRHLPAMRNILRHETPSFYRDKLVEPARAARICSSTTKKAFWMWPSTGTMARGAARWRRKR